ncbi:MAG: S1C family serine protease [Planctomycetota bacterium]
MPRLASNRFARMVKHASHRFGIPVLLLVSLLGFTFGILSDRCHADDNTVVAELKLVQQKINSVVAASMPACVAVTDGTGFGSGVIVSADGLVLTAGHVMASSGEYELILPSGKTVTAKPLGKNLAIDAGMLQIIEKGTYPFVPIDRAGETPKGAWVVSLGHSGGFELGRTPPVRSGRVLGRKDGQMFTDAVLIGGDSGGPLFNLEGELIGIHSSIGDTVAENRHVTMPAFLASWDRMKAGKVWGKLPELDEPPENRRGVIGVRVDLKAPNCRIRVVNENSPAAEAGLKVGDIVIRFNDVRITDGRHLIDVIKQLNAGDVCTMKIRRNEKEFSLGIQLR